VRIAIGICLFAAMASGQAAQQFDAASIRPSDPQDRRVSFDVSPGGRLTATNVTVRALLRFAYQLADPQISGGPGWVTGQGFNIVATPAGEAKIEQVREMVKALLAARFQVVVSHETKPIRAYALVLTKSGSKLTASTTAEPTIRGSRTGNGATHLVARGVSLERFASMLPSLLGYPVLDRTGLSGVFDFDLEFTPQPPPPAVAGDTGPPPDLAGMSIFTALQDQLGLKLESRKEPVEMLTIQRVEKPTEN
jgi:uncharacterized protein (TIGR03435 family)